MPITDEQKLRLESAFRNLDRVIGWTTNADNKALILITFNAVALGAVIVNWAGLWAQTFAIFSSIGPYMQSILGAALTLCAASFLCAIAFALRAIFPDLNQRQSATEGLSLFFFASIEKMLREDFIQASTGLDADAIERELLSQVHAISKIVTRKFDDVRLSLIYGAVSYILLVAIAVSLQLPNLVR